MYAREKILLHPRIWNCLSFQSRNERTLNFRYEINKLFLLSIRQFIILSDILFLSRPTRLATWISKLVIKIFQEMRRLDVLRSCKNWIVRIFMRIYSIRSKLHNAYFESTEWHWAYYCVFKGGKRCKKVF